MCNATKLCLNIIIFSRELKLAKISLAWKAKQLRTEWNKTYLLLQSSDFHVTIRSRESTTKTTRLTKGSRQDVLLHATARFIYLGRRCVIMKWPNPFSDFRSEQQCFFGMITSRRYKKINYKWIVVFLRGDPYKLYIESFIKEHLYIYGRRVSFISGTQWLVISSIHYKMNIISFLNRYGWWIIVSEFC